VCEVVSGENATNDTVRKLRLHHAVASLTTGSSIRATRR
jgi:hypothetical protein